MPQTPKLLVSFVAEVKKRRRKFGDGLEKKVGFGRTNTLFRRKGTENGDGGANASTAGHLQIFWRVAYVDAVGGAEAHQAQSETQWGGMRFAKASITAADESGEAVPEFEFAQLAVNTVAVTAGDETESVTARQLSKNAACAGEEPGAMLGVVFAPDLIGSVPAHAREVRCAIHVVPVG